MNCFPISFAYLQERRSETTERYLWTSEWDKLCLLSEWEWGYSYPNGSVNETLVEWTEGLNKLAYEGLCEGMNLRCKDWLNAVYDKWRNSKKEGTEGEWLRMKWALAMQRRANEWCDWRWNTPEGEWVTKRTDGLKIKTQSLCFHMKDGRSDTFRFVKRSETKRLFVNETSHKDT